jgi:Ca2+-binding RTX toxin-like protein
MQKSSLRRAAALAAVGLGALASTGTAAAATTPMGCTASVGRATLNTSFMAFNGTTHVIQANRSVTPCATDAETVSARTFHFMGVIVATQKSGAFTGSSVSSDPTAAVAPSAGATASTQGVTITYPNGQGGSHTLQINQSTSTAGETCVAGAAQASGSSTVGSIYFDGVSQLNPSIASTLPVTIYLPGSNNKSYIETNLQTRSGTTFTQDAVLVHINGLGDFALNEATVDGPAGSCPAVSAPGVPSVTLCPAGTTFVPATLACQVGTTVVSLPYQGSTGGTIIPLAVAQKLYPGNPCVKGAGPAYVIVATPTSHIINGTKKADRILGLNFNDRIAGLAGNDCISAGNGKDNLYDSNGNDRMYAGNGNDRIALGNGVDIIQVGNGNSWINAGRAADTLTTGNGKNRIDLGKGKNRIKTGKGKSRIYSKSKTVQISCGNKKDVVFTTKNAAKYARHHGCKVVRIVR